MCIFLKQNLSLFSAYMCVLCNVVCVTDVVMINCIFCLQPLRSLFAGDSVTEGKTCFQFIQGGIGGAKVRLVDQFNVVGV